MGSNFAFATFLPEVDISEWGNAIRVARVVVVGVAVVVDITEVRTAINGTLPPIDRRVLEV